MEALITMLQEASNLALALKHEAERSTNGKEEQSKEQESSLNANKGFANFPLTNPLVVLSLFDGIGGAWAALQHAGIPYVGYSSEIEPHAIKVLKARYPEVQHVGDVRDLRRGAIEQDVDLIIGGFPCQDMSSIGKRAGLHGSRSKLYFEMLRILRLFRPKWFLVENVASMTWIDREEVSKYLKCIPIQIDSQDLTPSRRNRLYWTNIPFPKELPNIKNSESTSLQSVLDNATALEPKIGVILSSNRCVGVRGELQRVFDNAKQRLRYLTVTEVEKVMGYPAGYTDIDLTSSDIDLDASSIEEADDFPFPLSLEAEAGNDRKEEKRLSLFNRWRLLGNSFSIPVISYLLAPLLNQVPYKQYDFSDKFREPECSVIERGEVWALYNAHERPNWYAVIASFSGGRFQPQAKRPLKIGIHFLEMVPKYLSKEADKWNPIRGTGFYKRMQEIEVQDTWVTFSHRMPHIRKVKGYYFICPSKDDVWAVCYLVNGSPDSFFVYVKEVELDWKKAETCEAGSEGFAARCTLMRKTVDKELFRCTETEVMLNDLAQFSYRVPYHFKSEAGLFKLELSSKERKYMRQMNQQRKERKKRKKNGSDDSDDQDDDDDADDAEAEDEVIITLD